MNGQPRIGNNSGATTIACVLCGGPADGDGRSAEHIIPEALGGWKTVTGFICGTCNSKAGYACDAALSNSLKGWITLLEIKRQKPLPRDHRVIHLTDGTPIRRLPGNRIELAYPVLPDQLSNGESVAAPSLKELRQIIQKLNDRRDSGIDIESTLANATTNVRYIDELIELEMGDWGPEAYRSLVKSALALIFRAGQDPGSAEIALAYLTGDAELRCFFPYYSRDLVRNREAGMPINCVHVKGDPVTRELMAYVEIFGILRSVIRLSEQYTGDYFEDQYAFDPTDGHELELVIELNSAILAEAEREPDYYGSETGALETAVRAIIRRALSATHMKELTRIVVSAVDEYFAEIGKGPDEPVTEDEYQAMWDRISEAATPFLEHLHRPMKLPDELQGRFAQVPDGK